MYKASLPRKKESAMHKNRQHKFKTLCNQSIQKLKQPDIDCYVTLSPFRAVLSFYILLLTNGAIVKHHLYLLRRSPRFWFRQEWIVQHFNAYLKTIFFMIYREEKSSISFKNGNFSCNIIVSISFECIIGDTIKTKCTG